MACGSASDATLAASLAATQSQSEAAQNALNFAKDVYSQEKFTRAPYIQGGQAGEQEWLRLLGLQGGQIVAGGPSTSASGLQTARSGSGGSSGSTRSSGSGTIQTGYVPGQPQAGYNAPLPAGPYNQPNPPNQEQAGYTGSTTEQTFSGPATATMIAPDGSTRLVPTSLVPYFQQRGLQLTGY